MKGDRALSAMRALVLGIGVAVFGLFAYVVYARFRYPIDAEWLAPAVREGVARVRAGEPLYLAPNERFIPFVYPPLYHFTCALVARVTSVLVACKLVSLAATAACAFGIARIGRLLGATRFWIGAAVLLHFASYAATLMFFDLERVDVFAAAIVMMGLVALMSDPSLARTAAGGAVLGLAFFAKQPHVLAFAAAAGALAIAGERRRALVAAASGAAAFAIVFAYLEITTHGWFRYYCVTLPGAHGIEPRVLSAFFVVDLPRLFVPAAATIALAARLGVSLARRRVPCEGWSWRDVLFASVATATMLEAFLLRAHRGGWSNVILAWTPLGCAAVAVVGSRLEAKGRVPLLLALAGVAFELLGGAFDPGDAAPNADDLAERERFVALVRRLERGGGEVLATTASDVTEPRHFHMAALHDVLRAGAPLPEDIRAAIDGRRYAAVVVKDPMEFDCDRPRCEAAYALLMARYFVAGRREERAHSGTSGFDGRPRWIMRPRKNPLATDDVAALRSRIRREEGLATARAFTQPPDADAIVDDTIEDAR